MHLKHAVKKILLCCTKKRRRFKKKDKVDKGWKYESYLLTNVGDQEECINGACADSGSECGMQEIEAVKNQCLDDEDHSSTSMPENDEDDDGYSEELKGKENEPAEQRIKEVCEDPHDLPNFPRNDQTLIKNSSDSSIDRCDRTSVCEEIDVLSREHVKRPHSWHGEKSNEVHEEFPPRVFSDSQVTSKSSSWKFPLRDLQYEKGSQFWHPNSPVPPHENDSSDSETNISSLIPRCSEPANLQHEYDSPVSKKLLEFPILPNREMGTMHSWLGQEQNGMHKEVSSPAFSETSSTVSSTTRPYSIASSDDLDEFETNRTDESILRPRNLGCPNKQRNFDVPASMRLLEFEFLISARTFSESSESLDEEVQPDETHQRVPDCRHPAVLPDNMGIGPPIAGARGMEIQELNGPPDGSVREESLVRQSMDDIWSDDGSTESGLCESGEEYASGLDSPYSDPSSFSSVISNGSVDASDDNPIPDDLVPQDHDPGSLLELELPIPIEIDLVTGLQVEPDDVRVHAFNDDSEAEECSDNICM